MAGEKILEIDDSPTVQRLVEMILSSQGYQVVLASDGEEGIAKAKSEKPALILVDFVMPKINGFQVCKSLKEDPEFKDTPIILVTSKGDKVGSKFVDVLGITEYFTKPFQPEELLAKIREVLDKTGGKKKAAVAAEPTPARGIPKPSLTPGYPAPAGLEEMVHDIVERVLEDLKRAILPDLIRREIGKYKRGAATAPDGGKTEPGIRGDLASFRIVEVLQMLGLQRQTGRMTVTGSSTDIEIHFREGSVVFASTNCNGSSAQAFGTLLRKSCRIDDGNAQHVMRIAEMTGDPIDKVLIRERLLDPRAFTECLRKHTESIMYRAMALKSGEFVFEKTAPPLFANPIQLKVDDILLEGARRADEWVLIQQKIPNFDIVFEPTVISPEELASRGLSDIDASVFSQLDGYRSVQDVIDSLCLGEFEVAKSLFILLSVNLVGQKQ